MITHTSLYLNLKGWEVNVAIRASDRKSHGPYITLENAMDEFYRVMNDLVQRQPGPTFLAPHAGEPAAMKEIMRPPEPKSPLPGQMSSETYP